MSDNNDKEKRRDRLSLFHLLLFLFFTRRCQIPAIITLAWSLTYARNGRKRNKSKKDSGEREKKWQKKGKIFLFLYTYVFS
jgi:hypothetical protein